MPTAARHGPDLDALEALISSRIREFEVCALLDLLGSIGYAPEDIEFRGHRARGPQPTLIHTIDFPPRVEPERAGGKVVVIVNLGLLSCRSPLPTYFQRFFNDIDSHDAVLELLHTLDRSLLHVRLARERPERAIADWPRTCRDFLRVFGLDAPIGLSWLFRAVFPELGVVVRRIANDYAIPFVGATLGLSELGACSFGDRTNIGVHDMEVVLICEDAEFADATPWIAEGNRRLRTVVFPLLDEICMTLTVVFVLMDRGTTAHVSPRSYAGYDPMWPDEVSLRPPDPPSRIELYRGALPRLEPDAQVLEHLLGHDRLARVSIPPGKHTTPIPGVLGRAIELQLVCEVAGRRHGYVATVHWSARAWYREEPHAIALTCEGVVKTSPTARTHPRLWTLLRDAGRDRIADRLTHGVLATVDSDRVTVELIEQLIDANADEQLHALALSEAAPMSMWDDDAWARFATWSAREPMAFGGLGDERARSSA
ncbi:hypothetical protein [Enhygromyxa salina]|uniref:Uncharacterized protein n=1 Tax=Enhygromyxa salina TaxID=215803 RepID=A0A2S9YU98_9BACT|nr:hypothetical protein [Enhygromyxa salina]PRQ08663.1 hypothetical protein ENSA7_16080 [Enhygromyxa salina]